MHTGATDERGFILRSHDHILTQHKLNTLVITSSMLKKKMNAYDFGLAFVILLQI